MQELEKKLNYTFHDQRLLREALNHSSYANEHRAQGMNSNERLEFLGDSVLGFVTAEYLFARHPDLPEGDLTRIRAALVCEQSLHEVAQKLGLAAICGWERARRPAADASAPPFWRTPPRRYLPRCILMAAFLPLPRSFTVFCWMWSGKR